MVLQKFTRLTSDYRFKLFLSVAILLGIGAACCSSNKNEKINSDGKEKISEKDKDKTYPMDGFLYTKQEYEDIINYETDLKIRYDEEVRRILKSGNLDWDKPFYTTDDKYSKNIKLCISELEANGYTFEEVVNDYNGDPFYYYMYKITSYEGYEFKSYVELLFNSRVSLLQDCRVTKIKRIK